MEKVNKVTDLQDDDTVIEFEDSNEENKLKEEIENCKEEIKEI